MNPEQQEQNLQTNLGNPQRVTGFTEVAVNPVQEKIAKLNKSRSNSIRVLLSGILGVFVGFGTCASMGEEGIAFGLVALAVSVLSVILGLVGSISKSWEISYFQSELKKGSTSTRFPVSWMITNILFSLILAVISFFVIGYGLCSVILSMQ